MDSLLHRRAWPGPVEEGRCAFFVATSHFPSLRYTYCYLDCGALTPLWFFPTIIPSPTQPMKGGLQ